MLVQDNRDDRDDGQEDRARQVIRLMALCR